ncbi:MAG: hypothetical protein BWX44_01547 [Spirochaetes bacterium ADurb.Bin001]|jgi:hypothetical protein|nr:MAG: hypothetical protein BWX44_01547 [Spirochaetes bacterium ADurb.Bin001]
MIMAQVVFGYNGNSLNNNNNRILGAGPEPNI